jgi:hypothetical protein
MRRQRLVTKGNMDIVLQSKGSSAFIKDLAGAWTEEREHAHIFGSGLDALFFCFKRRLNNMQMVATFLDSRMNFCVPVADVRADKLGRSQATAR